MKQWTSVDEVLDFAIGQEVDAANFYTDLAGKVQREWMKKIFLGFAEEEKGHKRKLEGVKQGKKLLSVEKKVLDLKIGDYLVDAPAATDLDYQQALVLAMKKEKKAFMMYSQLAEMADDGELKNLFAGLAQEEAKHKLRFEVEYDDFVMTEN
ncbi:MAG: ferritin family protein [Thermodesulfobacteriota bacterium]